MKQFNKTVNVVDAVISNLKYTDGATVDVGDLYTKGKGYAVGVRSVATIPLSCISDIRTLVRYYVNAYSAATLGFWRDTHTDVLYIDLINIFKDKDTALSVANQLNELAIYDFKNKKEIRI